MKIRFEWEGKNYEVEVERAGDRLTLIHQGKRYVVTLLSEREETKISAPPGSTQISPATPQAPTVPPPAGAAAPTTVSASTAAAAPSPASAATPAATPTAELDSAGALHAPMTGVIREIKVSPGHHVDQGQVVLIMEAMKMDIDVPSPASGIVAEVLVTAGDTVSAQQKLMVIH